MDRNGVYPVVAAGSYPPELLEVCRMWSVQPGALLAWSVRRDGVSIVLPSGQKVGAGVAGDWSASAGAELPELPAERLEAADPQPGPKSPGKARPKGK